MCKNFVEWLYLLQKNNLAYYDALTGCYNRLYYYKVLLKKMNKKEVYIAFLDLNNLKKVNDSEGHSAGDDLITGITNKLKKFGITCRLGGDEFLVIIAEKKLKDFEDFAKGNEDFCYAVMKKEKDQDLATIVEKTDEILIKNKEKYKKENKITR